MDTPAHIQRADGIWTEVSIELLTLLLETHQTCLQLYFMLIRYGVLGPMIGKTHAPTLV